MIERIDRQRGGNGDSRKTRRIIIFIAALVALVILLLSLLRSCSTSDDDQAAPINPGGGVTVGTIDTGKVEGRDKDIQTLLNEQVAEGMFRVFVATRIDVDAEGNMSPLIQNAGRNRYYCWVEFLDEYGTQVYATDVIPPGYKVETDVMEPLKSRGLNKCSAVFHLLSGTTRESGEVNSVEVAIDIMQE